jgi:hypothetical protein
MWELTRSPRGYINLTIISLTLTLFLSQYKAESPGALGWEYAESRFNLESSFHRYLKEINSRIIKGLSQN